MKLKKKKATFNFIDLFNTQPNTPTLAETTVLRNLLLV